MTQEEQPKPRFTGIFLPVEILNIEELNPLSIILLSWIDALFCEKHGGCYASNDHLAKRLKIKPNTISKMLVKLRDLNLIEDVDFNGRVRVIKANLSGYKKPDQSNAALDNSPMQDWKKIQRRIGKKSIQREKKESKDTKEIDKEKPARKLKQATAAITFNLETRSFEGITEEDLKDWRATYTAVNIDKELNECRQWAMSNKRKNYRKSINTWFRNTQTNHTTSRADKVNQPSLQVPVAVSDADSNNKLAIDLVSISDKEKVHHAYKLELVSGALRFNKPGSGGAVDISYNMEMKSFRNMCRLHLSKISEAHPIFKVYFKSEDNID